jgi:hypothetical protein
VITPVAQRQIFQTANIESVRAAHEVSEQIQREQSRKKTAEDRAAEDQASVRVIPGSDRIRTEERREGHGQGGAEEAPFGAGDGEEKAPEEPAGPADSHLDFLA